MEPEDAQSILAQLALASLSRVDERRFSSDVEALIKNAERGRLQYMKKYRMREMTSSIVGLTVILIGGAGFGWFFLVEAQIFKAIACMVLAGLVPVILNIWAEFPVKAYIDDHKANFMPQMAKALGGLKYHRARGISAKILPKTGVIPSYDTYKAEDCFMGVYKGVKVIFSEARLFVKRKNMPVFHGIFVLLEIPRDILEGHTIVTADKEMAHKYSRTRWKNLSAVSIPVSQGAWDRFEVFSDKPEAAALFVGEKLLKELAEASDIFNTSPLSAVFFKGKYVFLAIPYEGDMFEASNIYVPVTTKKHAASCKKEIEQILEIIDVFEIYQTESAKGA